MHQVDDEAIEEILADAPELCCLLSRILSSPRSVHLDVLAQLLEEFDELGSTLRLEDANDEWSAHLVVNLQSRRLLGHQHEELLGVLLVALAPFHEHQELHVGGLVDVGIVLDDQVAHELTKGLGQLHVDADLDHLIEQLRLHGLDVLVLAQVLRDLLEVLLLGSHRQRLEQASVHIVMQVEALIGKDVAGKKIGRVLSELTGPDRRHEHLEQKKFNVRDLLVKSVSLMDHRQQEHVQLLLAVDLRHDIVLETFLCHFEANLAVEAELLEEISVELADGLVDEALMLSLLDNGLLDVFQDNCVQLISIEARFKRNARAARANFEGDRLLAEVILLGYLFFLRFLLSDGLFSLLFNCLGLLVSLTGSSQEVKEAATLAVIFR